MKKHRIVVAAPAAVLPARDPPRMFVNDAGDTEEDIDRMDRRVQDAVSDGSGRLKLYINNSAAARVHDDVGRVEGLRELYCYNSPKLTSLPLSLTKLCATLQLLDASNCALESIPEDLNGLCNLRHLNLANNNLTAFLWDCSPLIGSLETLNLESNRLTYFSHSYISLFAALQRKEEKAGSCMLHPPQSTLIDANPFLGPTDHLLKERPDAPAATGSNSYDLSDRLPHFVENCCVCGKMVIVGRPHVFVRFGTVRSVPKRRKEKEAANSDDERITVRVPFFFPFCGAVECSNKLFQRRL